MKKAAVAILISLVFCATLIWITRIGAGTALEIRNKGYVNVTGYAKQGMTSDLGIFKVSIQTQNPDLKLAYEKIASDRESVKKFLNGYGFTETEIGISSVSVTEKYKVTSRGFDTHEFAHFTLSQAFKVESRDVFKVERMAAEIGNLLGQGIEAMTESPRYIYTGLEDLKIEMIGRAAANAKERAEILAKNGRFKLGSIADVRVGVFQITPLNSTEVSDYGINDTSSIRKEIKSTVEVRHFVR